MFLLDMAWDLNQVHDALQRLPQRSWDTYQRNLNFIFESNPQSSKERIMKAVHDLKVPLFGFPHHLSCFSPSELLEIVLNESVK